jgi:hypothetical protein
MGLCNQKVTDAQIAKNESGAMASSDKQWRIDNVEQLRGLRLQLQRYTKWSENWDHDHCAACCAKFAEFDGPNIQHEGYATCEDYPKGAHYDWICKSCFDDLKDDMQWSATSASSLKRDQIYIPLIDEGTEVIRPTFGLSLGGDTYRVLATPTYNPNDENWKFPPGSIVRCAREMRDGSEIFVAQELVSED